jgi:hypothetical protein
MTSRSIVRLLAPLLLILVAAPLRGQNGVRDRIAAVVPDSPQSSLSAPRAISAAPPNPLPPRNIVSPATLLFPRLVRAAGIIFSGRVTTIGGNDSFSGKTRSTTVTFHVEHAIRGATAGKDLTIREWAGLWAGSERYRVGERVLLFLYPPSKLGLTSPVSGGLGRFAINSEGAISMNPQQAEAFGTYPALGGRTSFPYADFERAVRHARREE